jgi:hypothetical protein
MADQLDPFVLPELPQTDRGENAAVKIDDGPSPIMKINPSN